MAAVLEQIESRLSGGGDTSLSAEATWKLVSVGAGVLSGLAARKVLSKIWGRSANDGGKLAAVQWAIASGIAVGVGRTVGMRLAGRAWERATGAPPPGQAT